MNPVQALDEVAEHVSPDAHNKGRYRLRSEAWSDWDPHHPHYTRKDRDQALHNARQAKWRPESQMHALGRPLPRTLRSLLRLLDNPLLLRSECAVHVAVSRLLPHMLSSLLLLRV